MSSRVLRKLKGEEELGVGGEDIDEDDLVVSPQKTRSKKKKPLNSTTNNHFDVLLDNDDDDDACTISVSSEDEETSKVKPVNIIEKESNSCSHDTQVNQNNEIMTRTKKKPRKKKKRRTTENNKKNEDDTFEDLPWDVKGIPDLSGNTTFRNSKVMDTRPVLMIEYRNLNAEQEMCRRFGSRIVRGDKTRSNHRRTHHSTWLINPRQTWPRVGKSGLTMRLLYNREGYTYFAFEHSQAYQMIQFKFLDAVESMDPNNISGILNLHGYHIDSLLQLSEVCKLTEDYQMAAELVERALYCFECSFHPLFNVTQGRSRMDYRKAENRPFFLALFHHLTFVGKKGCYRTALELCKLLLSLSPDEDPLGVLLMIDFYALHSGEYNFLIRIYDEWDAHKNLSQLPNFAFSIALAHFHRFKSTNSPATADELLQKALINFPSALMPLLDKCAITLEKTMMNHPFFGITSQTNEPKGLKQLVVLFVGRTFSEWKDPEVVDWLASNVKRVLERVDKKDPYVMECAKKRQIRYQGTPRNIYRHIILSDIKEASTALPVDMTISPMMSYDPLPPVDSIAGYSRPERRRVTVRLGNPLSEFVMSLWPTYSLNTVASSGVDDEDREGRRDVAGAEGGPGSGHGGNLTRGVENLMTAMRELLNTMTYRGDGPNGNVEDGEDHEWVDENN